MEFRIKNIVLWPKDESLEPRKIEFALDKINIITGESHTGKSSLVHIIDYCLGSRKCTIPVGVIRATTEWFGLHIVLDKSEIMIARREPGQQFSTSEMYYEEMQSIDLNVKPNANINSRNVINRLNQIGWFSTSDFKDEDTEGFLKDRASFRDTSAFQFQPQHIVANPYTLFFKADTWEHQEKLKTIFPLMLGAIDNKILALRKELRENESELRTYQNELTEKQRAKNVWLSNVRSLYFKGVSLGLLNGTTEDSDEWAAEIYISKLSILLESFRENPLPGYNPGTAEGAATQLNGLVERERSIAREISNREIKLGKIIKLTATREEYAKTIDRKLTRLEPIGWFNKKVTESDCPFCGNPNDLARTEVKSLALSNEKLEKISAIVTSSDLVLDKETSEIKLNIRELEKERSGLRVTIDELSIKHDHDNQRRLAIEEIYRFIGRLEEAMENVKSVEGDSGLDKKITTLAKTISDLKEQIGIIDTKTILGNALRKLSSLTANYVETLDIEQPEDLVKLDIKNLSLRVVSDDGRENFLWEIGSGANWMGYHLSIALALQEFFLTLKHSHVPTFLFIDQPTQVYFPEKWPSEDEPEDYFDDDHSDFAQARKIFKALELSNERTKGTVQLIITEHAPKFMWEGIKGVHLVEEWRGGKALIPSSWIPQEN